VPSFLSVLLLGMTGTKAHTHMRMLVRTHSHTYTTYFLTNAPTQTLLQEAYRSQQQQQQQQRGGRKGQQQPQWQHQAASPAHAAAAHIWQQHQHQQGQSTAGLAGWEAMGWGATNLPVPVEEQDAPWQPPSQVRLSERTKVGSGLVLVCVFW